VLSDGVADVFVDGRFVHAAPLANLPLEPGRHVVRVEGTGAGLRLLPRQATILLRPGESRRLTMGLR
jgi:hypothetical protein